MTSELEAGKHILKIAIEANHVSIDKIEFKAVNEHPETGADNTLAQEIEQEYAIYSMQGVLLVTVTSTEKDLERTLQNKGLNAGSYVAKSNQNGQAKIVILRK